MRCGALVKLSYTILYSVNSGVCSSVPWVSEAFFARFPYPDATRARKKPLVPRVALLGSGIRICHERTNRRNGRICYHANSNLSCK